jgi:hypothetical protein
MAPVAVRSAAAMIHAGGLARFRRLAGERFQELLARMWTQAPRIVRNPYWIPAFAGMT